jgi:hypothetical protein
MDMKEASAMTEASGLTDGQGGDGTSSRTRLGSAKPTNVHSVVAGAAEQLRKNTLEAPLRSLALAFLFGVWVARRR